MLMEMPRAPRTALSASLRDEPVRPLDALHPLILEVCRATRAFRRDPLELGPALRGAALGAAEAVLQSCREERVRGGGGRQALEAAARRLRELGCSLQIARRLGQLEAARCAEIVGLLAAAHDAVRRLAEPAVQGCAASTRRAGSLSQ